MTSLYVALLITVLGPAVLYDQYLFGRTMWPRGAAPIWLLTALAWIAATIISWITCLILHLSLGWS